MQEKCPKCGGYGVLREDEDGNKDFCDCKEGKYQEELQRKYDQKKWGENYV